MKWPDSAGLQADHATGRTSEVTTTLDPRPRGSYEIRVIQYDLR